MVDKKQYRLHADDVSSWVEYDDKRKREMAAYRIHTGFQAILDFLEDELSKYQHEMLYTDSQEELNRYKWGARAVERILALLDDSKTYDTVIDKLQAASAQRRAHGDKQNETDRVLSDIRSAGRTRFESEYSHIK